MSIANEAVSYTQLGWHLLPLHARDKRPCIDAWQHNASCDGETVKRWFETWPSANVGLLHGPNSKTIDVEADDEEGEQTADELLGEIRTPTWDSQRGTHRLFQYEAGLTSLAVTKARGLEIRVGANGKGAQSMLPPSMHPSGKRLAWREGLSPFDVELQPIPDSVRQLLSANGRNDGAELVLTCTSSDLATAPGVAEGERNKQLCVLVGTYLATHGNDAQLMRLALDFGLRCDPPLPANEVFKTVQGIVTRHFSKGGQPTVVPAAVANPRPNQLEYRPFPTDALPATLADFVRLSSKAISCDESYIALPMLSTIAASIGNSVRFQVRPDWEEPAIVWTGIVGPPGDRKTPAIAVATEPLLQIENQLLAAYDSGQAERDRQQLTYEADLKAWKQQAAKGKVNGPPPLQVEAAAEPRLWADDTTIEGLAMLLHGNPRGLLLRKDELTAWLRSFTEYKKAGGDLQRWLSIHNTSAVAIDRKGSDAIRLWRPNVSITGGIQPALLEGFFGGEHVEAGLMQRFLFSFPPSLPGKLARQGIGSGAKRQYEALLRRLQQVPYEETSANISLSEDAWDAFRGWHDFLEQEFKPSTEGLLREVASKLVATAVRLGGIMQCANDPNAMEIEASSMRLGITLARWFLDEWCRVHDLQAEPVEVRHNRQLVDFIASKFAGRLTPAELSRYRRDIRDCNDAESALMRLTAAGWGAFEVTATAGRPRREFVLNPDFCLQKPKTTRENHPLVDATAEGSEQ